MEPTPTSTLTYTHQSPLITQYNLLKQTKDPRFGDCTIFKHQSLNKFVVGLHNTIPQPQDLEKITTALQNDKSLNHSNVTKLLDFEIINNGEQWLLIRYYEYPSMDLKRYAQLKQENKQRVDPQELFDILSQQVQGH